MPGPRWTLAIEFRPKHFPTLWRIESGEGQEDRWSAVETWGVFPAGSAGTDHCAHPGSARCVRVKRRSVLGLNSQGSALKREKLINSRGFSLSTFYFEFKCK